MPSTTADLARPEQINRWVVRDALSLVLHHVGEVCEIDSGEERVEFIAPELQNELFSRLWPDTEPDEVADIRSTLLASSIFVQLAESRDDLLREGARLAALAEKRLRAVGTDA